MSNVLDQIKRNAVPAAVMRSAAKGALPLPPAEMLEILVYLTHNPVFAQDARMTLASWDAESAGQVMRDAAAPPEVLGYFWTESNRRPSLMPALIANPAISENMLIELAAEPRRETLGLLLASARARSSPAVMEALQANPALAPEQLRDLTAEAHSGAEASAGAVGSGSDAEAAYAAWHKEHASEIAAAEGKPFELVSDGESAHPGEAGETAEGGTSAEAGDEPSARAAAALGFQARARALSEEHEKQSVLQKVARLNASERVRAAFNGGREERGILIRDGAKVVQLAVLSSPKLTDPEVETFAAAKNVSEFTLREIARNRRFMKNYNVVRNLVNNAKTPLDVSLALVKNLMVFDLKGLRFNKEVAETIRKVAAKLYREKTGPAKESRR
jgi:hypothetical protein